MSGTLGAHAWDSKSVENDESALIAACPTSSSTGRTASATLTATASAEDARGVHHWAELRGHASCTNRWLPGATVDDGRSVDDGDDGGCSRAAS